LTYPHLRPGGVRQRCRTDRPSCGVLSVVLSFFSAQFFPVVEVFDERIEGKRGSPPCREKSLRQEDGCRTRWTGGRRSCVFAGVSADHNSGQCSDNTFGGQRARRRLRPDRRFTGFLLGNFRFETGRSILPRGLMWPAKSQRSGSERGGERSEVGGQESAVRRKWQMGATGRGRLCFASIFFLLTP
jgi:hypothetical protein